ncbi:hypothetical protein O181_088620 [Austropuccinia psidii MF-1]|uniref:Uncharacterized protein n=1 Tax=Austropuccinia psidii MF-1 TaxID=1389203 RepID=A0A9Q3IS87_9BASI|nr:hypothetical protein [Austropuccinia psidii MF-1]
MFEIFSKQQSQWDMEVEIKPEMKNDQYSEDSLEDVRNKIFKCLKDEDSIKEYNREECNQTDEFQICGIYQDPPKKKIKSYHAYENLWEVYINHDSSREIKPRLSSDSKPEENPIEAEVSPLKKDTMNTILSYDLNPQSQWRMDKEKKCTFMQKVF